MVGEVSGGEDFPRRTSILVVRSDRTFAGELFRKSLAIAGDRRISGKILHRDTSLVQGTAIGVFPRSMFDDDRLLSEEESLETSGTIDSTRSGFLSSRSGSIGSPSFSRASDLFQSIPGRRQMSDAGEIQQGRSLAVVSFPNGSILLSRSSSLGSLSFSPVLNWPTAAMDHPDHSQ